MEAIEALPAIDCGEDAAKYFDFDEGWRNLNHGEIPLPDRLQEDSVVSIR